MAPRDIFLNMGWFGRSFGCNGRINVSSTALDSYGSLLFNAASLAIIRAVLAMIQHERSGFLVRGLPVGIPAVQVTVGCSGWSGDVGCTGSVMNFSSRNHREIFIVQHK